MTSPISLTYFWLRNKSPKKNSDIVKDAAKNSFPNFLKKNKNKYDCIKSECETSSKCCLYGEATPLINQIIDPKCVRTFHLTFHSSTFIFDPIHN